MRVRNVCFIGFAMVSAGLLTVLHFFLDDCLGAASQCHRHFLRTATLTPKSWWNGVLGAGPVFEMIGAWALDSELGSMVQGW